MLTNKEAGNMAMPPSNAKIFYALKAMKPYKAPGSDGLHAEFFSKALALCRGTL